MQIRHVGKLSMALVVSCGTCFSIVAFAMDPEPGQATCRLDQELNCFISWNLSHEPKETYRIERYDLVQNIWVADEDANSPCGTSSKVARPGNLYRVVGCDSKDCSSATQTYWVPIFVEDERQIPQTVTKRNGAQLLVMKDARFRTQLLQYNVYLFVRDFENVKFKSMPAMTEPPEFPTSLVDMIHDNVYPNYMGYRAAALGELPQPLAEREDARVIHPEGHPEHEHSNENF